MLTSVTVGLGLGLLLAEVLLRLVPIPLTELRNLEHLRHFYELDAQDRIQARPGWVGTVTVDGRATDARTNALGLRGPEVPAKTAGERRVLFLGDSFTWGTGVAWDETIPHCVQQLLADQRGEVRCGNAGMWGTGPREWTYTLDRHRATFRPDAVVAITYAGNDPVDTLSSPLTTIDGWVLDAVTADRARSSWRFRLALRSRLWFYLEWYVLLKHWPMAPAVPTPEALLPPGLSGYEGYFLDIAEPHAAAVPWIAPVSAKLQQTFAAFARTAADLPTLVVVLPGREASSREMWRQKIGQILGHASLQDEVDKFERGACSRRLARLARAAGLDVVDLTDRILGLPDPDAIYLGDYHYNPAGCRLVAEWIAPAVAELLTR